MHTVSVTGEDTFESFVRRVEPALRRALVAGYGSEVGREVTVDALAYAWKHFDRVAQMKNPAGYLYRVGQTRARRSRQRFRSPLSEPAASHEHRFEPGLQSAMRSLTVRQRQVVSLVHAFEWTHAEVANLLGISRSSVQKHLERALTHLRRDLGVDI